MADPNDKKRAQIAAKVIRGELPPSALDEDAAFEQEFNRVYESYGSPEPAYDNDGEPEYSENFSPEQINEMTEMGRRNWSTTTMDDQYTTPSGRRVSEQTVVNAPQVQQGISSYEEQNPGRGSQPQYRGSTVSDTPFRDAAQENTAEATSRASGEAAAQTMKGAMPTTPPATNAPLTPYAGTMPYHLTPPATSGEPLTPPSTPARPAQPTAEPSVTAQPKPRPRPVIGGGGGSGGSPRWMQTQRSTLDMPAEDRRVEGVESSEEAIRDVGVGVIKEGGKAVGTPDKDGNVEVDRAWYEKNFGSDDLTEEQKKSAKVKVKAADLVRRAGETRLTGIFEGKKIKGASGREYSSDTDGKLTWEGKVSAVEANELDYADVRKLSDQSRQQADALDTQTIEGRKRLAELRAENQRIAQERAAKRQAELAQRWSDIERRTQEANAAAGIDPRAYWKKQSAGQRILMAVAGFAMGFGGNTKAFLDMVQNGVDAEIDAQKDDYKRKTDAVSRSQNLYAQAKQVMDDETESENAVRAIIESNTIKDIDDMLFAAQGDQRKVQRLLEAKALLIQQRTERAKFVEGVQGRKNEQLVLPGGSGRGGVGGAKAADAARKRAAELRDRANNAGGAFRRYAAHLRKPAGAFDAKGQQQGAMALDEAKGAWWSGVRGRTDAPGEPEQKKIDAILPDPSKSVFEFGDVLGWNEDKRQATAEELERQAAEMERKAQEAEAEASEY